ncbi:MAG: DUF1674 domain-containing protein [Rhodospirillales bacterium]|nr:DUF1674 domain-containing protein [Rhodospirillales bacterium]
MSDDVKKPEPAKPQPEQAKVQTPEAPKPPPKEIGGQAGPEPTRYGDWEKAGRCTDF